ncbi:MAG: AAA family ATPase [Myxococcales bacterium]|nr:AAA family ATPase [Myxococcales bacterium]
MPTHPPLPIGTADFRKIREAGKLYVDKTALIDQVVADPAEVLLLPRPRRFGKTTNLSTLRYFFERSPEDLSALFADLAVWRSEPARARFQRHPVIYLTLKDLKKTSFDECLAGLGFFITQLYSEHQSILEAGQLTGSEADDFRAILERRADQTLIETSLRQLSIYLHRRHGEPVVILLDEYDTPLHSAFFHGYYDAAVALFRGLLGGAFKDNRSLYKGVLTGILRVAKESIFSDLNNLAVHSLLEPRYAPYFGFTEPEVVDLARRADHRGSLDELRDWYNGYLFGGVVIYNPWSVLSALDRGVCAPYWVNTSANELIRELLLRATGDSHLELEAVLRGESVHKPLTEHTVLRDIYRDTTALWSFLLFSGYLAARDVRRDELGGLSADLGLPNRELRSVFANLFKSWLQAGLGGPRQVEDMSRALLRGDLEQFEHHLARLLVESASTFDTAGTERMPPEQLYHAFVLGLLLHLQPDHAVRSNRESGYGRADVLVVPRRPGLPGVVLELKVKSRRRTLAQTLADGLQQLADQDYAAELRAAGAAPIHEIAVAFDGKRVLVGKRPPPRSRPAARAPRRRA